MSAEDKRTGRRNFLKQIVKLGAGGAFWAAAGAALAHDSPAVPAAVPAKHESQGYRITPHIQTYYEKAAS